MVLLFFSFFSFLSFLLLHQDDWMLKHEGSLATEASYPYLNADA